MVACFESVLLLRMCCALKNPVEFLISLWTFDFYEVAIGKAPLRKKIARARAGSPSRNFPVVHPVLALLYVVPYGMSYGTYRYLGSSFRRHSMELSCCLPEITIPYCTLFIFSLDVTPHNKDKFAFHPAFKAVRRTCTMATKGYQYRRLLEAT
jgi:hypothetical protein